MARFSVSTARTAHSARLGEGRICSRVPYKLQCARDLMGEWCCMCAHDVRQARQMTVRTS